MASFVDQLFDNKMPPHGHCYLWDDHLVSLHVVSDIIIVLAYFTIPLALIYLVRRRDDLRFNYIFVLFAVFIFACGASHLMNIYNVWYGAYWLSGSVKAVTALASMATAVLVWPLLPKALAIPSNRVLLDLNEQLREVAERNAAQAREVEEMSEQLEEQIRNRTAELEEAKSQLEANNLALEASNRELAQYAHVTSHDLQEPLKKIRSLALLAGSRVGPSGDMSARDSIEGIVDTSERMIELVESLLVYSEMNSEMNSEANSRGGKAPEIDANSVLAEVLSDLSVPIRKHKVTVLTSPLPPLPMQRFHLHQVLLNLIGNAIRYSADESESVVEIGPLRLPDRSLTGFHVRDNGIGISEQKKARLFELVERGQARSEAAGSGMGLVISQKIVSQYGGSIEVDSEEGEGANFKVYLPGRN